ALQEVLAGAGLALPDGACRAVGHRRGRAAARGAARVGGAHVAVVAVERRASHADAGDAGVVGGADVAVVAAGPIGRVGVRAMARGGITRAYRVAGVGGRARHGVRSGAGAALAGVGLRAGVTVVAGRPVLLGRRRAGAGRGIAGAEVVAL